MSDAVAYTVLWFANRDAPLATSTVMAQRATAQRSTLLYRGSKLQR